MSDLDRFDEAWQEYKCSDCDPTLAPEEDSQYDKPYVMIVPEGEIIPDFCPRCGSYLSLLDGANGLRIANTPAERYAQRERKDADDA